MISDWESGNDHGTRKEARNELTPSVRKLGESPAPPFRRGGVFTPRFHAIVLLLVVTVALGSILSIRLLKESRTRRFVKADVETAKLYSDMRRWDEVATALFEGLESKGKGFVSPSGMNEELLKEVEAARKSAKAYSDTVDAMMANLEQHKGLFSGTYYEGVLRAFRVFWGPHYKRQQQAHLAYLSAYRDVVIYKIQHEREITERLPEASVEFARLLVEYRRTRKEAEELEDMRVEMLQHDVSENPELKKYIEGYPRLEPFGKSPQNGKSHGTKI